MVKYYNLDVIISVGYRVKSQRGTQFRIWANRVLKYFLVKGHAVNERTRRGGCSSRDSLPVAEVVPVVVRSVGFAIRHTLL